MLSLGDFFTKLNKSEQQFENAPIENHTFYEYLYQKNPEPIFTSDRDGNIVEYNDAFIRTFNFKPKQIDDTLKRLIPEKQLKAVNYEDHYDLALKGKEQTYFSQKITKDETIIETENILIPVFIKREVVGVISLMIDITQIELNERIVNNLKTSIHTAEKITDIGIWNYDVIEENIFWSDKMFEMFGIDRNKNQEISYKEIIQCVHIDDREDFKHAFQQTIDKGISRSVEYRIVRSDGTERIVKQLADVILDENGQTIRLVGTIYDITDRKIIENQIEANHDHQQKIYNHLFECVWSFDTIANKLTSCSQRIKTMTGYTAEEFFSNKITWDELVYEEDKSIYKRRQESICAGLISNIQYRIVNKNNEIKWIKDKTIPTMDDEGNLISFMVVALDITDYKKSAEKIEHLAYHDHLTDLPNRKLFEEELDVLLEQSNTFFAIMHIDLDGFKRINDTLGHEVGDHLLIHIASRLRESISLHNLVARVDGDEFSILIRKMQDIDQIISIAQQLIEKLDEPYHIDEFELYMTASIGIATFPADGTDAHTLLKKANAALYRAKHTGKNNYKVYSSTMDIESYKTYYLERDLRKAIERNELILHYQPKVDAHTQKIVGAEALIRWQHPDWDLISPNEFIPLSEENGLIFSITDWAFRAVCDQLKVWGKKGLPLIPISINISPKRMLRNDWADVMIRTLKETHVSPTLIELEITESSLIYHEDTFLTNIERLKALGIKLALDDFGTGYSSLLYLKKYKVDTVKIDKSFIKKHASTKSAPIIKAIIGLTHELNMNVVAEGVETEEQLDFLQKLDCDQIQGYLFSKPLSADDFEKFTRKPVEKQESKTFKLHTKDNRKLFRFDLPYPLSADMTITEIKGKTVKLGKTEVLIGNIGIGGLSFLTHLRLPVQQDIIITFESEILGNIVNLSGHIVWSAEVDDDFVRYGFQYMANEDEQAAITALVNNLAIRLRKTSLPADCRFITEDEIRYLESSRKR